MRKDFLIYQYPINYLAKVSLYLENLFSKLSIACNSNEEIIHHYALKSIIDIINLIEKPEIKSRYVKDLMRIEHLINQSQTVISDKSYARLFVQLQILGKINSRFGNSLYQDSFVQSMRFVFNSKDESEILNPQLIFWLNRDVAYRQNDISGWLENLLPVYNTVDTYLSILRETAEFCTIDLESGYFNKNITNKLTQHFIVIKMRKLDGVIPKVNLINNIISVRLCDAHSMQEVRGSEDFQIELAICQL